MWQAYNGLGLLGYVHDTVNHSLNYVNPVTGTTTNHVEAHWSEFKQRFKSMHGTQEPMIPSYLDEFMWRERYGTNCEQALNSLMFHISEKHQTQ